MKVVFLNILALTLVVRCSEAKRVEVKTAKDKHSIARHLNKQQSTLAKSPFKAISDPIAEPDVVEEQSVSFFGGLIGSLFSKKSNGQKDKEPDVQEVVHGSNSVDAGGAGLPLNPAQGKEKEANGPSLSSQSEPWPNHAAHVFSGSIDPGNVRADGNARRDTNAEEKDGSFAASDTERKRQLLLHKQRLEMQELESRKMREIEDEVQRKRAEAEEVIKAKTLEADMKLLASKELEEKKLKEIEKEIATRRRQLEEEENMRLAEQDRRLRELEEIEWQKIKELDSETERKRVATEAFLNQSMKLREMEINLERRETEFSIMVAQQEVEMGERRHAIDDLVARRLQEYELETELRKAAADKVIKAQEDEIERRWKDLERLELQRLQECDAEIERMMENALAEINLKKADAEVMYQRAKEFEITTLEEIDIKLKATQRINQTLIREIELEAKKKAKETEEIESRRRVELEAEIERRRLVISDLVTHVEIEIDEKRKMSEVQIAERIRALEHEIERNRSAAQSELNQLEQLVNRRKKELEEFEAKKMRDIDEEVETRMREAEELIKKIKADGDEKRKNAIAAEEFRLQEFELLLQNRRVAAEAIISELEAEAARKRNSIENLEKVGLQEFEDEVQRKRAIVDELVKSIEQEAHSKRKMLEELENERTREFEFSMQRRRDAAEAALADVEREADAKRKSLEEFESRRLKELEDEVQRRRLASERLLRDAEVSAAQIRQEMEDYRAEQLRSIENETIEQKGIRDRLISAMDSQLSMREAEYIRNETRRRSEVQKEFDEKRAEAERLLKEAEELKQERLAEFEMNIQREMAATMDMLRVREQEIEEKRKSIEDKELRADQAISEKMKALELSLQEKRSQIEEELEAKQTASDALLLSAQLEADSIRSRAIDAAAKDVESELITTFEAERERLLLRTNELEQTLSGETKKNRMLDFENNRLVNKLSDVQQELFILTQKVGDLESEKQKIRELKDSFSVDAQRRMEQESEYHGTLLELKRCELERKLSVPDDVVRDLRKEFEDERSKFEIDKKTLNEELSVLVKKLKHMEDERFKIEARHKELEAVDEKRIYDLESQVQNLLLKMKTIQLPNDVCKKEPDESNEESKVDTSEIIAQNKELEELLGFEITKSIGLEADKSKCEARYQEIRGAVDADIKKTRQLEEQIRQLSKALGSCEQDQIKLTELEAEKYELETKCNDMEKRFATESKRSRDLEKEKFRSDQRYDEIVRNRESDHKKIAELELLLQKMPQCSKSKDDDMELRILPTYKMDKVSATAEKLSDDRRSVLKTTDFEERNMSVMMAIMSIGFGDLFATNRTVNGFPIINVFVLLFGVVGIFIILKLVSCCLRPFVSRDSSPPVRKTSLHEQQTHASSSTQNFSSSQSRIFGNTYPRDQTDYPKMAQESTKTSHSALVGRIKRIIKNDHENQSLSFHG